MKPLRRLYLGLALTLIGAAGAAQNRPFVVAHSMIYKGGVDLTSFGIQANPIVYESSLLPSKTSDVPASKEALRKLLNGLVPGPLPTVLDVERWSTGNADPQVRRANVEKLVDMLKRVRDARGDLQYGFYGEAPTRTYWSLVDPNKRIQKGAWSADNDRLRTDLTPHVDAVFPSLYTFYDDLSGWELYARETLAEARKFGKPIYCYLWPQFHTSNVKLSGQYLSANFWRLELETCRKFADGIVIWDHSPNIEWNPDAPWWKETEKFMRVNGLSLRQ